MPLDDYVQRVQRLLNDQNITRYNPYDLIAYINEARMIVAAAGQCIRAVVPSTAGVAYFQVTNGGSNYTNPPAVSCTPPLLAAGAGPLPLGAPPSSGSTATGFAEINTTTGEVSAVLVQYPGAGYTAPPAVTLTGGGGAGAAVSAVLQPFCQTIPGQETYSFRQWNPILSSLGLGVDRILGVYTISVSWGNLKPTLRRLEWGGFQAYLRAWNIAFTGYPLVFAQTGMGDNAMIWLWPIPNQAMQMDVDALCLPQALLVNDDIEAIPFPWTDCVPFQAALLAAYGEGMPQAVARFEREYDLRLRRASAWSNPVMVPDYYDPASMS